MVSEFRVEALEVAGLTVHSGVSGTVVAAILDHLRHGGRMRLSFCNAHMLALALRDADYAGVLSDFTLLNDGVGLDIAAMFLLGRRFPDNLNGTDLIPKLIAAAPPSRIFLLGAGSQVARKAADRLTAVYPQHEVVGTREGFFKPHEVDGILAEIRALRTDILLLGMGNPLQEQFVRENALAIDANLVVCAGALLDFLAERVPRASPWIRKLRLEWVFRLFCEPRRLLSRYTVEAAGLGLRLARIKLSSPALPIADVGSERDDRQFAIRAANAIPLPRPSRESHGESARPRRALDSVRRGQ